MQVTKLKEESTGFQAKITIPQTIIDHEIQKSLAGIQKKAKLPGFRPGKIPLSVINKKYGAAARSDVIQDQIDNSVNDIVKSNNFNVVTTPKIEDLKASEGQDLEFTLKLEIVPKIQMPDFNKIVIEKPLLKVTEQEIKEELKILAKNNTVYTKEKKGKAAKNDQITLDAIGSVDGKEFEGGKLNEHKLVLGSKSFIDNFEDQLIGSDVGDEIIVKVTFPEKYHAKDLAGKPAEFKVNILAIHEAEIPKIDEEFAKSFKFDNLKAMEERMEKTILDAYDRKVHTAIKMQLFDELEKILDFDVPASLFEKEYKSLKTQIDDMVEKEGDLEVKTPQEREEYYKKLATRRVRIGLLLSTYAKDHKLIVTEHDIKNAIIEKAKELPGYENMMIDFYRKNPEAVAQLQGALLEEKAVNDIFANHIKLTTKEYDKKSLDKILEENI